MANLSLQDQWWNDFRQTGDINSFHNLHSYFYSNLVNFAFTYLKVLETSEEVVDDVFVCIWEKRESISNVRNIKSYLFTCTRNRSLDHLRRNKKQLQLEDDIFKLEKVKIGDDVSELFENVEFLNRLQDAIDQLPKQCKLIYKMHLNEGMTNAEIADALGLAKKTIEAQIYIAYKKLTVILKALYNA